MDRTDLIARGERASLILTDPVFQDAIADIEEEELDRWRATDIQDTDAREKAFFSIRALDLIKAQLGSYVTGADVERDHARKAKMRAAI